MPHDAASWLIETGWLSHACQSMLLFIHVICLGLPHFVDILLLVDPRVPVTDWSARCYCPAVSVESVALYCWYVCPQNCNATLSLVLHPQASMSHLVRAFLLLLHCWGPHTQCKQVHGVVWAIQHNPNAYYATPVSVQQVQNSYVPFFSFLFVLGGTAYAGDIIAVILQWCMLFMVLFCLAFSCASSTITSNI